MSPVPVAAGAGGRPFAGAKFLGLLRYKHAFFIGFLLLFIASSIVEGVKAKDPTIAIKSIADSVASVDTKLRETITIMREKTILFGRDLKIGELLFPIIMILGLLYFYYYWFWLFEKVLTAIFSKAAVSLLGVIIFFLIFFFILEIASHVVSSEIAGQPTELNKWSTWAERIPFSGIWHKDGLIWNIDLFITPMNKYNPFGSVNASVEELASVVNGTAAVVKELTIKVI